MNKEDGRNFLKFVEGKREEVEVMIRDVIYETTSKFEEETGLQISGIDVIFITIQDHNMPRPGYILSSVSVWVDL